MKAPPCRMPVRPPALHPPCSQGTRGGSLYLNPPTAARRCVLTRGHGGGGGVPRAGPRWPQDRPLRPDKLCSLQTPTGPQSRMQSGTAWTLCTEASPAPGSPSAQCSCIPSPASHRASGAPFRLLHIASSTVWRGGQKPKASDRDAICKRSPTPGSSKCFMRSVIFGERPGFEPYCDYLLSSPPLASCFNLPGSASSPVQWE